MMKVVRFLADAHSQRSGLRFNSGEVYFLRDDIARFWVSRGAAEYLPEAPVIAEAPVTVPVTVPEETPQGDETEEQHGDTMGGSADVEGPDSGGAGERAEPEQKRRRGRPPGRSSGRRGQ